MILLFFLVSSVGLIGMEYTDRGPSSLKMLNAKNPSGRTTESNNLGCTSDDPVYGCSNKDIAYTQIIGGFVCCALIPKLGFPAAATALGYWYMAAKRCAHEQKLNEENGE